MNYLRRDAIVKLLITSELEEPSIGRKLRKTGSNVYWACNLRWLQVDDLRTFERA